MRIKLMSFSIAILILSACGGTPPTSGLAANPSGTGTDGNGTGTGSGSGINSQLEAEAKKFAECFGASGSGDGSETGSNDVETACTGADVQKVYDSLKCFNDQGFCEAYKSLNASELERISGTCQPLMEGISQACKDASGAGQAG